MHFVCLCVVFHNKCKKMPSTPLLEGASSQTSDMHSCSNETIQLTRYNFDISVNVCLILLSITWFLFGFIFSIHCEHGNTEQFTMAV